MSISGESSAGSGHSLRVLAADDGEDGELDDANEAELDEDEDIADEGEDVEFVGDGVDKEEDDLADGGQAAPGDQDDEELVISADDAAAITTAAATGDGDDDDGAEGDAQAVNEEQAAEEAMAAEDGRKEVEPAEEVEEEMAKVVNQLAAAGAPNATALAPNSTALAPNTTALAPNATALAPNATALAVNTTALAPSATALASNASALAPNITTVAANNTDAGNATSWSLVNATTGASFNTSSALMILPTANMTAVLNETALLPALGNSTTNVTAGALSVPARPGENGTAAASTVASAAAAQAATTDGQAAADGLQKQTDKMLGDENGDEVFEGEVEEIAATGSVDNTSSTSNVTVGLITNSSTINATDAQHALEAGNATGVAAALPASLSAALPLGVANATTASSDSTPTPAALSLSKPTPWPFDVSVMANSTSGGTGVIDDVGDPLGLTKPDASVDPGGAADLDDGAAAAKGGTTSTDLPISEQPMGTLTDKLSFMESSETHASDALGGGTGKGLGAGKRRKRKRAPRATGSDHLRSRTGGHGGPHSALAGTDRGDAGGADTFVHNMSLSTVTAGAASLVSAASSDTANVLSSSSGVTPPPPAASPSHQPDASQGRANVTAVQDAGFIQQIKSRMDHASASMRRAIDDALLAAWRWFMQPAVIGSVAVAGVLLSMWLVNRVTNGAVMAHLAAHIKSLTPAQSFNQLFTGTSPIPEDSVLLVSDKSPAAAQHRSAGSSKAAFSGWEADSDGWEDVEQAQSSVAAARKARKAGASSASGKGGGDVDKGKSFLDSDW